MSDSTFCQLSKSASQLLRLRGALNNRPRVHRLAFLMEVLATSAPHYRELRGGPLTALPVQVAKQMDAAAQTLRMGKAADKRMESCAENCQLFLLGQNSWCALDAF